MTASWAVEQRTHDSLHIFLSISLAHSLCPAIHHRQNQSASRSRRNIEALSQCNPTNHFLFCIPLWYGAGIGRKGAEGGGCTYLNNSCPRQETPSAAAADNCFGLLLPAEAYITLDENKGQARLPSHYPPCLPAVLRNGFKCSPKPQDKTWHQTWTQTWR